MNGDKIIERKVRMRTFLYLIFLVLFTALLSCSKVSIEKDLPNRTVIAYMVADNNLDYFSVLDINEMEEGFSNSFDGNLIVYIDRANGASPSHPYLLKIKNDTTDNIVSEIVKVYPEQNSCDPSVFHSILSDIMELYSAQKYGLILWSHGTSWFPEGFELVDNRDKIVGKGNIITKSFGNDQYQQMDIISLTASVPVKLDYIIFDACYMGAIETIYELKDNADYIVGSPTEILSFGFPYKEALPFLFETSADLVSCANSFYNYYNNSTGIYKSATISVVKTSELNQLSDISRSLLTNSKYQGLKLSSFQQYELSRSDLIFDFAQIFDSLSLDNETLKSFHKQLNKTVIYKASTEKLYDTLSVNKFSGLSIYYPDTSNHKLFNYYKTLKWYEDSGMDSFFN